MREQRPRYHRIADDLRGQIERGSWSRASSYPLSSSWWSATRRAGTRFVWHCVD